MAFAESITRGDSRTLRITATWPEAVPEAGVEADDPFSLSGKLLIFTAKENIRSVDEDATFQKRSDGVSPGIVVSSPTNIAHVEILPADTEDLPQTKTLQCDFQVIDGTDVWTVAKGTIQVTADVTRASS